MFLKGRHVHSEYTCGGVETLLRSRGTQIKTVMSCHLIPLRTSYSKRPEIIRVDVMAVKKEKLIAIDRDSIWFENSIETQTC